MSDDLQRLDAWRAGDAKAGQDLFERHFESVRRFFRNKAPEATEDLVQKTFLATVESRDRFKGTSSFRTYLFAVARNVLVDHIRAKRREDKVDLGTVTAHDLGPSPSEGAAQGEKVRDLLLALRRIPLDFQIALELFYWEQLRSQEIAEVLAMPHGTVRSRLRRGRELLAEALEQLTGSRWDDETTIGSLESWARRMSEQARA